MDAALCSIGSSITSCLAVTPQPILVVDDEPGIRNLIRQRLELRGYACQGAASAGEALGLSASSDFAAVISDLRMPGGSGLQLVQQLRQRGKDVPVLLVTGVEDVRTAVEALKSGASDYLLKPLDYGQLIFALTRALENHRVRKELEEYRCRLESLVQERTHALHDALQEVHATHHATLEALVTALDYRDHETNGHSRRVAAICESIAQRMGVDDEYLHAITYGAYLHDIGKIAIPDAILRKPGPLTSEEQAIMRTHVEIGYRMVNSIPIFRAAADIVLAHHEAYDGSGYPRRLKRTQIPLGARLFAVADTVDAITSDRPYRKARSMQTACEELKRCSGTQFDPSVVEVFLSLETNARGEGNDA